MLTLRKRLCSVLTISLMAISPHLSGQELLNERVSFGNLENLYGARGYADLEIKLAYYFEPYFVARVKDVVIESLTGLNGDELAALGEAGITFPHRPDRYSLTVDYRVFLKYNRHLDGYIDDALGTFNVDEITGSGQVFPEFTGGAETLERLKKSATDVYGAIYTELSGGEVYWKEKAAFGYINPKELLFLDLKNDIERILRERKDEAPEEEGETDEQEEADEADFWNGQETAEGAEAPEEQEAQEADVAGTEQQAAAGADFWSGGEPAEGADAALKFWQGESFTHFELDDPEDNYETDQGVYELTGTIKTDEAQVNATLIGDDYRHPIDVTADRFRVALLLKSGVNNFRIQVNGFERSVRITCTRPPVKLRASLVWNTSGSDIDLQLIDPYGNLCNYQNKTVGNSRLDVDNTRGYGPENIYVDGVMEGTYTVKIHNYSGGVNTQATVYVYVDEELRETKQLTFSSNKELIQVADVTF